MEVHEVRIHDDDPAVPAVPARPSWWQLFRIETRREGFCLFTSTIFALGSLAVIFCVILVSNDEECPNAENITIPEKPTCQTPECIQAASYILQYVDEKVNPCDNFYKFACGNYQRNGAKFEENPIESLNQLAEYNMHRWLTEENASDPINIRNQRKFYKSCQDVHAIEKDGNSAFLRTIDNVIGGWPKNGINVPNFNWVDLMLACRKFGLPYNFFLSVEVVYENGYYIQVRPPPVPRWFTRMNPPVDIEFVKGIPLTLEKHGTSFQLEPDLFYAFVKRFTELLRRAESPVSFYKMSNLNDTTKYLQRDWRSLLSVLTTLSLSKNDVILYGFDDDHYYFQTLNKIINDLGSRFAVNYVIMHTILAEFEYLGKNTRNVCRKLLHVKLSETRREFCRRESSRYFSKALETYYTKQVMTQQKRSQVDELVQHVIEAIRDFLEHDEMLDRQAKLGGRYHLQNTRKFVGYTDLAFQPEKYYNIFELGVTELNSSNVIHQLHEIFRNNETSLFQWYRSSPEPFIHSIPPMEATPYYKFVENVIYTMSSALMSPIFDENRPQSLNFGLLGTLLGSAFVKQFLANEPYGKPFSIDINWETKLENTIRKVKDVCVIRDFDQYLRVRPIFHMTITSTTIEELLEDFGGLNLAYRAYQKWTENHETEHSLPGLNYTSNQLFWIISSSYLCADLAFEEKFLHLRTRYFQKHAMPSYRVDGPRMHSPYFAKDFHCKSSSKMYKNKKCLIFA